MLPHPLFTAAHLAWLAGLMLLFWAPFWSGFRLPLVVLLAVGLYLHARSRQWLPALTEERRWGAVLLLLLLPCLVSSMSSADPKASLAVCLVLILHYWVGLALLAALRQGRHAHMALWMGLTLLFWTVDGAMQMLLGRDLFGVPPSEEGRMVGPFDGNLHMGLFIAVLMPLLLWPLATRRPWLALLLFPPLVAAAALAGARTNLVFVLLVACALALHLKRWRHRLVLAAFCLTPLLVIPFSPALQSRLQHHDYASLQDRSVWAAPQRAFDKLNVISSYRLSIWKTASAMFQAHPWLGIGPGAFGSAYPRYAGDDDPFKAGYARGERISHAHQMYVSTLAETGLAGLAGLFAVIGLIARWYWRAPSARRDAARPWLVCLAVIAFPINSQPVLFTGWWFPMVALLLCGLLAALEAPAGEGVGAP